MSGIYIIDARLIARILLFSFYVIASAIPGSMRAYSDSEDYRSRTYEEVVVTARKQEERLIDVPISISVIGSETIMSAGIQNMHDLSYMVPNLSIVERSSGLQVISIRGIGNSLGSSPLIGIYLDEIPVSITPSLTTDLQTTDLERLEVLKGPQGTLYGQGSVGGTIRFITKDPAFDAFNGVMSASAYSTTNGGWSEELSAIVNLPVVENKLALRLAASYKDRSGWIDQPDSGVKDANKSELTNIRFKGLWKVSDKLTLNAMMLKYENDEGGFNFTNVGSVNESIYKVVEVNGRDLLSTDIANEYSIYNFKLSYDFDFATLVSSSSKFDSERETASTSLFPNFAFTSDTLGILNDGRSLGVKGFSQEVRLANNTDDSLDWVVGVFYTDVEEDLQVDRGGLYDINGIPLFPEFSNFASHDSSTSTAIFGNVSYDLSSRFTLSVGTRYFENKKSSRAPSTDSVDDKFYNLSSKISISYALTEESNLFASISEGFRSGGLNSGTTISYEPENVISYEVGAKSSLLGGKLNVDGAAFFSEYSDYQNNRYVPQTGTQLIQNPGEAEIQGIEWSSQFRMSEAITVGFTGNVTETEFTEISSTVSGFVVGDPIDFIPKYSYSFNADIDFNWTSSITGFARIDYNRQGPNTVTNRSAGLVEISDESGAIGILNMQIGAQWRNATIRLFGRNINNEKRSTDASLFNQYVQNRPRTFGISLDIEF